MSRPLTPADDDPPRPLSSSRAWGDLFLRTSNRAYVRPRMHARFRQLPRAKNAAVRITKQTQERGIPVAPSPPPPPMPPLTAARHCGPKRSAGSGVCPLRRDLAAVAILADADALVPVLCRGTGIGSSERPHCLDGDAYAAFLCDCECGNSNNSHCSERKSPFGRVSERGYCLGQEACLVVVIACLSACRPTTTTTTKTTSAHGRRAWLLSGCVPKCPVVAWLAWPVITSQCGISTGAFNADFHR